EFIAEGLDQTRGWFYALIVLSTALFKKPAFKNVIVNGMILAENGEKMSKRLKNYPEPMQIIDKYGADGVRVGLLLSSAAGNDLLFDEELCEQGRNFSTKIWNAFRLVQGWEISETIEQPEASKIAIEWYQSKFQQVLEEVEKSFENYRLSEALMSIYKLIWDDFSSWYLEMIKPAFGQPIDQKTYDATIAFFESNLKILHPYMPFLTEEIWQHIKIRTPDEALIIATYPVKKVVNQSIIADFEMAVEVISGIRTIRKDKNIPFKETIKISYINNEKTSSLFNTVIIKMGNLTAMNEVSETVESALSFRVKSNEYFIPLTGSIDIASEIEKLTQELIYTEGFLKSVQVKLSNERFVTNAPEKVLEIERKKESDSLAKIETIKTSLKAFQ
ncbi:MAG: class I tRNA ligase family protein, partial [Flavobacteriaceae bacterium]|nr:class I tRNA ligase family protein [Flavobacteriaceae bacterium]